MISNVDLSKLIIMDVPLAYKGKRCFAWYLSVTTETGKAQYFVSSSKAELKRVFSSIRPKLLGGYAVIDWIWLDVDGKKATKSQITNKSALDTFFSDPQRLLVW